MPWRMFQRLRTGPINWNLSNRGIGWSIGVSGFRYGFSPSGHRYVSIGIPNTGMYWIKYLDSYTHRTIKQNTYRHQPPQPSLIPTIQPKSQASKSLNEKLLFWKKP
jgi:hypothetical protein